MLAERGMGAAWELLLIQNTNMAPSGGSDPFQRCRKGAADCAASDCLDHAEKQPGCMISCLC